MGNPATSFSILIGSIPSDPLYVLSANQQRLYERCYTSDAPDESLTLPTSDDTRLITESYT